MNSVIRNMVPSSPSDASTEPKVPVSLSLSQKVVLSALAVSNSFLTFLIVYLRLARVPFFSIFWNLSHVKSTREFPIQLHCMFGPDTLSRAWALIIAGGWEEMHIHVAGTESHLQHNLSAGI